MKHIEPKYLLVISLLTLGADSALAGMSSGVDAQGRLQKNKSELTDAEIKAKRNYYKKIFLEEKRKKAGFHTKSFSDFFKKLKQAENS